MSVKQLEFETELLGHLARFENRLLDLKMTGLTLWTRMLRSVAVDAIEARKKRDAAIYRQLMLLETAAKAHADLVARIQSIKGMLTLLCLGLSLWSICELAGPVRRSGRYRSGTGVRLVARGNGKAGKEWEIV